MNLKLAFKFLTSIISIFDWKEYLTWLLTITSSWLVIKVLSRRKLRIKGIVMNSIQNYSITDRFFVTENSTEFFDGVSNEMIVYNPNEEIFIHSMEVEILKLAEYLYDDRVIKVSFDKEKQMIYVMEINNGSKETEVEEFELVYYEFENLVKTKILKREIIKSSSLKPGEIKLLIKKTVEKLFYQKNYTFGFGIKVLDRNGIEISKILIFYDYKNNQFLPYGGLGANYNEFVQRKIPIYELTLCEKTKKVYSINSRLSKGINLIEFIILTDFPVILTYNIKFKDINNREIINYSSNEVKIKFKKYVLRDPFNNEFNNLFSNNTTKDAYTYDEINKIEKDPISVLPVNRMEYNKNKLIGYEL